MEEAVIYDGHNLEGEIGRFVKVWLSVIVSLCYCFFAGKVVQKGMPRLFSFIPIVFLFLALPLNLHSIHLGGTSAFFIAWLANFKILLLAFDKGPLSDHSLSLSRFVAIACFPIKVRQNPIPKSTPNLNSDGEVQNSKSINGHNREDPPPRMAENGQKSIWNYAIKGSLVAFFIRINYNSLHPTLVLVIHCFHIYLFLELMLALIAALTRIFLGLELEAQFNEPYLSSSLQDFWGRRWNIMVSRILRPTVYDPTLEAAARVMGRKWAPLAGVMATFVVSALMHEIIFYYLGRKRPTWEITWFFLFHGFFLVAEIGVKKAVATDFRLPRVIATPMTVGFVMVTGFWWFFPVLFWCKVDTRSFDEYTIFGSFVKGAVIRGVAAVWERQ